MTMRPGERDAERATLRTMYGMLMALATSPAMAKDADFERRVQGGMMHFDRIIEEAVQRVAAERDAIAAAADGTAVPVADPRVHVQKSKLVIAR